MPHLTTLSSTRRSIRPESPRDSLRARADSRQPRLIPRIVQGLHCWSPGNSNRRDIAPPQPPRPEAKRTNPVRVSGPFASPPGRPATTAQPNRAAAPARVGECLALHWRQWQAVGAEPWVEFPSSGMDTVSPSKTVSPLPPSRSPVSFPTYPPNSPKALAFHQEVESMISKGAVERVHDPGPGFYSHLFLVEKASGGWRPVIDLSPLNEFVRQTPFKMETASLVLLSVREGDFLASIDLKDAYFQIPIRFVSEGTVLQFKILCFGLSTAPQVFTWVFATVSTWAHSRGVRLLRYLDDWLVLASSEAKTRLHVRDLLLLPRGSAQRQEVRTHPATISGVPRHDLRHSNSPSLPHCSSDRQIPLDREKVSGAPDSPRPAVVSAVGTHVIAGEASPPRETQDAVTSVVPKGPLVPRNEPSPPPGAPVSAGRGEKTSERGPHEERARSEPEPEKKKKESKKYAMKVKKTKPGGGGKNVGIENSNKSDT